MRIDAFAKTACWAVPAIFIGCCFAQAAIADPPENHAVLNWPRTLTQKKSFVWRDKKNEVPGTGMEGFVAYVRQNEGEDHFVMTIRLYDALEGPNPKTGTLQLAETYHFNVTKDDQINSKSGKQVNNKKNKSFHFMLKSKLRNAAGEIVDPESDDERTFLFTGTGQREKPKKKPADPAERNLDRTLRLTTFVTRLTDHAAVLPATSMPASRGITYVSEVEDTTERERLTPCSDYPDDAVLEEEVYSQSLPYPPEPDPADIWLSYSW